MLPDIWPGYQGMSEPYLTVIPPLSLSGDIRVFSSFCCLLLHREHFFMDCRWSRSTQVTTNWKLSKQVRCYYVGLYSASEVHKVTKLHIAAAAERIETCSFTVFAQIKIKWMLAGKLTIMLEFGNKDTNCFLISNEWALHPEKSGHTDIINAARLFWYDVTHTHWPDL